MCPQLANSTLREGMTRNFLAPYYQTSHHHRISPISDHFVCAKIHPFPPSSSRLFLLT